MNKLISNGIIIFAVAFQFASCQKYFTGHITENFMRRLVNYDSQRIKLKISDSTPQSFYYSPYRGPVSNNESEVTSVELDANLLGGRQRYRRTNDPTFRGNPKTQQEVWHRNFNFSTIEYSQSTSLVALLNKIVNKYLNACIPVVLYDSYVMLLKNCYLDQLHGILLLFRWKIRKALYYSGCLRSFRPHLCMEKLTEITP